MPPKIEYVTVWFTAHVDAFKGADGKTYGPFEAGESARIPKKDAESLLEKGVASYSPPLPKGTEEAIKRTAEAVRSIEDRIKSIGGSVGTLKESIKGINEAISSLKTSVDALTGAVSTISTAVYAAVVLSLIAAVAAIASLLKKRS